MNDLGHASLHLGLVQERLALQRINRFWQLHMSALKPWETTLESDIQEDEEIISKV